MPRISFEAVLTKVSGTPKGLIDGRLDEIVVAFGRCQGKGRRDVDDVLGSGHGSLHGFGIEEIGLDQVDAREGLVSVGSFEGIDLEGNVVRFAPLYEKYNGGKAMSSHWMKNRNATIFEPPHRKRRGRVSQNYRDELQRRRAKKARRRANH